MLLHLQISDFGIIDKAEAALTPGLNVITGETGAGKSLLVGALDAVLGGRISADMVRRSRERARIQAVFQVADVPQIAAIMDEAGLPAEEELYLVREIGADGRGLCRVNGSMVPLQLYRRLAENLADIHGQHDTQSLLRPGTHLDLLDAFAGPGVQEVRRRVRDLCQCRDRLQEEMEAISSHAQERLQRLDYLTFQIAEIEKLAVTPEEDLDLRAERKLLANAERLYELASSAYAEVYEREGTSAVESLARALELVRGLAAIDEGWQEAVTRLQAVAVELQDMGRELAGYRSAVEFDPDRLARVEDRLAQIDRLASRYGGDVAAMLAFKSVAVAEAETLAGREQDASCLQRELEEVLTALAAAAAELSAGRRQAAERFAAAVTGQLSDLGLLRQSFEMAISTGEDPDDIGPTGADSAEMMISFNPGEPLMPLRKVASGGELSRLALAIKSVLAEHDAIPVIVFDEIDVGIGGRIGGVIADKIRGIARFRQVICITHTPQIAAAADTHLRVAKSEDDESVSVALSILNRQERLQEIAAMMGMEESEDGGKIARQMLLS